MAALICWKPRSSTTRQSIHTLERIKIHKTSSSNKYPKINGNTSPNMDMYQNLAVLMYGSRQVARYRAQVRIVTRSSRLLKNPEIAFVISLNA